MRLRVAYLSPGSDLSAPVGSGVEHASARALAATSWADVVPLGPFDAAPPPLERVRGWLRRHLGLPRHAEKYSLGIARRQARQAERLLAALEAPPDLVLSAFPGPLAFLATDLPVIFYTDATMANVVDAGYRFLDRVSARSVAAGRELDRRALERSHLVVCRNRWAAASVVEDYGVDPSKVVVVPAGPCLPTVPDASVARDRRPPTADEPLRLLFVGLDWHRKGGDVLLETVRRLEERGRRVALTLIGATPDGVPAGVQALGRLAKDDPDDWAAFDHAFRRAHLLVQPSRREPCALVLAEAAAYGLPVVATDVGGIRTAVEPGESGLLVPPEDPEALAEALAQASRPESYGDLVHGSRRRHETLLSWPVAAREIGRALGRLGFEVCLQRDDRP